MAKDVLAVRCFMILPSGKTVPVEELSKEELNDCKERMSERLSETCSNYYSDHPEEYLRI